MLARSRAGRPPSTCLLSSRSVSLRCIDSTGSGFGHAAAMQMYVLAAILKRQLTVATCDCENPCNIELPQVTAMCWRYDGKVVAVGFAGMRGVTGGPPVYECVKQPHFHFLRLLLHVLQMGV